MAEIVNYRDLLLQGATTRYIPPATAFDPSTLGDLALLDQVNTPQIAPGSITAGSGIVAPGAILTQALEPGAAALASSSYASAQMDAINAVTDTNQFTLGSIAAFTARGGKIYIHGGFRSEEIPGGGSPVDGWYLRILVNGSAIFTLAAGGVGLINLMPVIYQTVYGQSVSITMTIQPSTNTFPSTGVRVHERSLFALEIRR